MMPGINWGFSDKSSSFRFLAATTLSLVVGEMCDGLPSPLPKWLIENPQSWKAIVRFSGNRRIGLLNE